MLHTLIVCLIIWCFTQLLCVGFYVSHSYCLFDYMFHTVIVCLMICFKSLFWICVNVVLWLYAVLLGFGCSKGTADECFNVVLWLYASTLCFDCTECTQRVSFNFVLRLDWSNCYVVDFVVAFQVWQADAICWSHYSSWRKRCVLSVGDWLSLTVSVLCYSCTNVTISDCFGVVFGLYKRCVLTTYVTISVSVVCFDCANMTISTVSPLCFDCTSFTFAGCFIFVFWMYERYHLWLFQSCVWTVRTWLSLTVLTLCLDCTNMAISDCFSVLFWCTKMANSVSLSALCFHCTDAANFDSVLWSDCMNVTIAIAVCFTVVFRLYLRG